MGQAVHFDVNDKTFMKIMSSLYDDTFVPVIGYIEISFEKFVDTYLRILSGQITRNIDESTFEKVYGITYERAKNETTIQESV